MTDWAKAEAGKLRLSLHIQPGAKKTEVAGLYGNALKIRLAAPPIDGRANQGLIVWLSDTFKVPQRQINIKSGESSRRKIIEITGQNLDPAILFKE